MSVYFEIAYAAASERLCLFTGTGFSKAITQDTAPSWQSLLELCCEPLAKGEELKAELFPEDGDGSLSLEEIAQIIDIELAKIGKNIHDVINSHISTLVLSGDNSIIQSFMGKHKLSVVTTNYDKLAETLIGVEKCHSLTPGLPIPRSRADSEVFHIHGSTDAPSKMVVTTQDYLKFINAESYFSRKLSTVLHENTVVILGYSLGDTNLKAILSDHKRMSFEQVISGNILLVSKDDVSQHIKEYYAHCYGIRVIDNVDIHDFFAATTESMVDAQKYADTKNNLKNVINKKHTYTDSYLKLSSSLREIVVAVGALGFSVNHKKIEKLLASIIERKKEFTKDDGAWDQYTE